MNLPIRRIPGSMSGPLLAAITLLLIALPVQASVIYNFTSSPVTVEHLIIENAVRTLPADSVPEDPLLHVWVGPVDIGSIMTASLTFPDRLPSSTTVRLSSEVEEFDLDRFPNTGNVEAFSAALPSSEPHTLITSDIDAYTPDLFPDSLTLVNYSTLNGEVTTNASGNISSWDLEFTRWGGFIYIDTRTNTLSPDTTFPSGQVAQLTISSDDPSFFDFGSVYLNGAVDSYSYTGKYIALADQGDLEYRYYSAEPGSFTPLNQVPVPGTLLLIVAALASWQLAVNLHRRQLGHQVKLG